MTSRESDARTAGLDGTRPLLALPSWVDELGAYARLYAYPVAAVAVLVLAVVVRASHVLDANFPLNDGGLFHEMARDLQRSGYLLPAFTSYNDGTIPFAYPPLALYLAALADALTPLSLVDTFRVLPLLGASLAVGAFLLLARSLLRDRWTALAATAAFALMPRSFTWLIMGGGLTRSFGLAFALLAMREAHAAFTGDAEHRWRSTARAAALFGLTAVTHVETAVFVVVTLPLLALLSPRPRNVLHLAAIGAGGALLSAPWWGLVLSRHGLAPFLAAMDHGGPLLDAGVIQTSIFERLRYSVFTGEPFFPLLGALGILGGAYVIARGRWLLPGWWLVIFVVDMRAAMTFAAVPTALMAGAALRDVVVPAFLRMPDGAEPPRLWRRVGLALVAGVVLVFAVSAATSPTGSEMPYLRGLSHSEARAMRWVESHTPEDARFLVVSRRGWYADREAEWFPAIAGRESVGTVQGYEWVEGEFWRRAGLQARIRECQDVACLERVAAGAPFEYVYIPGACCWALKEALSEDAGYGVLYHGAALVVQRLDVGPPPARRVAPR